MIGLAVEIYVLTLISPLRCYSGPKEYHRYAPYSLKNIARVHTINILGVEFTEKFAFSNHSKHLTIKARQSFYALRLLRSHGLLSDCLFDIVYSPLRTVA